jgi:hypothetical protein
MPFVALIYSSIRTPLERLARQLLLIRDMIYQRIYWSLGLEYTDKDKGHEDIQLTIIIYLDLASIWKREVAVGNFLAKDIWMQKEGSIFAPLDIHSSLSVRSARRRNVLLAIC